MNPQEKTQLRLMSIEAAIRANKGDTLIASATEIFEYLAQDEAKAQQAKQPVQDRIIGSGTITPFKKD